LVVDAELKEVIPSWFNSLGFFIELDILKLKQFLELGRHKFDSVQDTEYHKLLTSVHIDKLASETKLEIFEYVFNYYQKENIWLDHDIAEKLAFYYDDSFAQQLQKSLAQNTNNAVVQQIKSINAIRVIEYLFKYKRSSERDSFKDALVELIKSCNKSAQYEILSALKYYGSFEVITDVLQYYNTDDTTNLEHLVYILTDMKPNTGISLKYFIDGTRRETISSRYGLYKIIDSNLIELMIRQLISDSAFLKGFFWLKSVFSDQDHVLIDNIKNAITPSLLDAIEDFIIFAYQDYHYDIYDSQYVKEVINILKIASPNTLIGIILKIKTRNISLDYSMFDDLFRVLINKLNIEQFIKEIELLNNGRQFAIMMFWNSPSESELYQKGTEIFKHEFAECEQKRKEHATKYKNRNPKTIDTYGQFKKKLGLNKVWYTDIFRFYINHAEIISKSLTDTDAKRFEEIAFNILRKDPLQGKVEITNKQGSGMSYTMTQHMSLFTECLGVAKKFNWDLSHVQQNILNCIPFAYYQELELIFDNIIDVGSLNIEPIMEVYTSRQQDDLQRFRRESFIKACERYNLTSAIPILDKFIDDGEMEIQDRRLALEVCIKLKHDQEKLKVYFGKWRDEPQNIQLAEMANKLLIELFGDSNAIKWRIQEIKNRAVKVTTHEHGAARAISKDESELHHKYFAAPLLNISDAKYIDQYRELLWDSFEKAKEHNEYGTYVSYVWDIVCTYFSNLTVHRKYDPILKLEKDIYEKTGEEGTNWFKYRIQKLKREYSSYISKPDDILTCIQKYNKIVSSMYLFLKDHQGLISFIKDAIEKDLKRFVEEEGYYRQIEKAQGYQEDLIQTTLKTQIENIFLKNGIRNSDIIREPQLLDSKRPDFRISYGFLGPVLIELKTTSNKEIKEKKKRDAYKTKLQQYVNGFDAIHAYFLILQVSKEHPISKFKPALVKLYEDCDKISVLDLNCIKGIRLLN